MIKSILFDSGKVLNRPLTGHWFISPNFFEYVNKEKFLSIEKERINNAFLNAQKYLFNKKLIKNIEEELIHFSNFYKLFSENLPELQIKNIEDLAKDMVYNTSKYVFYEDVKEVIPRLKNKYKMAVVSDAWPSLENVFIDADMKKYKEKNKTMPVVKDLYDLEQMLQSEKI